MHELYHRTFLPTAPLAGNPLAVCWTPAGSRRADAAIASEFNYSETTFCCRPRDGAHDARVRIFTVRAEIPFAAIPMWVLPSCWRRRRQSRRRGCCRGKAQVLSRRNPPRRRQRGRRRTHRAATTQKLTQFSASRRRRCFAVGCGYQTDRHPPQIVSVGCRFGAELTSRDALRRATPDAATFARTFPCERHAMRLSLHA